MHKGRNILLMVLLVLFVSTASDAQILNKILGKKNATNTSQSLNKESDSTKVQSNSIQSKRALPENLTYSRITGITLDNIWDDVWWGSDYVPIIYLLPKDKNYKYEGKFDLKEYTKSLAEREQNDYVLNSSTTDLEEYDDSETSEEESNEEYTPIPEVYSVWSNASVDPYNVNLTNMKDTVRIDISSYYPPGYKYVTSEFGPRWGRLHAGIDLKVYTGDTIYCAFAKGTVRIKRFNRGGYGHYVVIRHENGLETLYGHMSKVIVNEGDKLEAGDPIGLGGSTGKSSGSHLHFELRYMGKPINPRDALDFNSHKVLTNTLVLTKENFRYPVSNRSKKSSRKRGTTSAKGGAKSVTVKKGDTLGAIARRNGTTVAKLRSLNKIKGNNIRAGQKIRVK